jgi:hypothetical protein
VLATKVGRVKFGKELTNDEANTEFRSNLHLTKILRL